MKSIIVRCISLLLVVIMACQLFAGCSNKGAFPNSASNIKNEDTVNENHIDEQFVSEEKFQEKYIVEHLIYEDGIYEYQISESLYSEACVFEMTVGELSEEEILANLPQEIQEYDIDWPKVITKFAIGTAIIITVGVVEYFSKGSTYFFFGSPVTVAKDALIGGAMGAAIGEVVGAVKNGTMPEKGIAKYALEGFADGYMWGAIASVLKIAKDNFVRLKAFKAAAGDLSINVSGQVFDEAGKLVGKAFYSDAGKGIWYLTDEESTVLQVFDKSGKVVKDAAAVASLKSLPKNSILRLGTSADAALCYTDDVGKIMRIGNELVPKMEYTLNGYTYYTDDLGRITKVTFDKLRLKPEGRARKIISDGKDVIGRGYELVTDDRGHLIADVFDGNNSLANIVAQDASVNKGQVKEIETLWKNCLEQGGQVQGSIELTYLGESFRPDKFRYLYDMGKGLVETIISNIL